MTAQQMRIKEHPVAPVRPAEQLAEANQDVQATYGTSHVFTSLEALDYFCTVVDEHYQEGFGGISLQMAVLMAEQELGL